IREGAERGVRAGGALFPMPPRFSVEIDFRQHFKARAAGFYPGCRRTGARTVAFEAADYMDVLQFLFWVL
ncbi:MAG: peptidase, partial [Clostridiales bacterium]|nr:peptidase [Clostridiales bacterium]